MQKKQPKTLNDILDIEEPQTTRGTRLKLQPNNSSPSRVGWRRGSSVHGPLVRCESEGAGSSEDISNSQQSGNQKKKKNPKRILAPLPPDWNNAEVPVRLQI